MGSQSITCYPAEVTFPPLPQPKLVLDCWKLYIAQTSFFIVQTKSPATSCHVLSFLRTSLYTPVQLIYTKIGRFLTSPIKRSASGVCAVMSVVIIHTVRDLHNECRAEPLSTVHNYCKKKRCRSKMPYMMSSRSVTDWISPSVSKSKLVYSSLVFVDNKLTLIGLLT